MQQVCIKHWVWISECVEVDNSTWKCFKKTQSKSIVFGRDECTLSSI